MKKCFFSFFFKNDKLDNIPHYK